MKSISRITEEYREFKIALRVHVESSKVYEELIELNGSLHLVDLAESERL